MSNYGFTTGASGYDDADRLKNRNRSDGRLDHSWDLSLVGDWNSQSENTQATSFTHNNVHELTAVGSTPLAYDIKGNLTTNQNGHTYTWDFNNRMESADTDSDSVDDLHFTYDAIGRRVSRNDGTTNTIFVSSGQQVIAEYLSGAIPTSPTEQYVYASYIDEPLIKIGTGGTLYYHRNRQYSIVALSDTTGNIVEQYAYTSTGVTTTFDANTNPIPTTTKNNPYTYTSRRLDPTLNLHYFRARWFDSRLGRFTNRDPLAYVDGMSLYRGYFALIGLDPLGTKFRTVRISGSVWEYDFNWTLGIGLPTVLGGTADDYLGKIGVDLEIELDSDGCIKNIKGNDISKFGHPHMEFVQGFEAKRLEDKPDGCHCDCFRITYKFSIHAVGASKTEWESGEVGGEATDETVIGAEGKEPMTGSDVKINGFF